MNKKLPYLFYFLLLLGSYSVSAQTKIGNDIDGLAPGDQFGTSTAISADGTVLAIGAPPSNSNGSGSGSVRILKNVAGDWTKIGEIFGENPDNSGKSVALSADGSVVAIGSPSHRINESISGCVRVYKNISGDWTKLGNDINGAPGDNAGTSVALSSDGTIVAVGADGNDTKGSNSGQVRIFRITETTWTQIGDNINGEHSFDFFGRNISLSADGSIVAVAAPLSSDIGKVLVFMNTTDIWTKIGSTINGLSTDYLFGSSVSISSDGTVLAIGCTRNGGTDNNNGRVNIYENLDQGEWQQMAQIPGKVAGDASGQSVSLSNDGKIIAIGAPTNDGSFADAGHVRIYQNLFGNWTLMGADINGEASGDMSGSSVSLSGDGRTVAIGALNNDANGSNSGQVRVYDLSSVLSSDSFVTKRTIIYPNPAKETVNIQLQEDLNLKAVNVYSVLGQLIKTEKTNSVDVRELTTGFYLIQVVTDKGSTTQKIKVE